MRVSNALLVKRVSKALLGVYFCTSAQLFYVLDIDQCRFLIKSVDDLIVVTYLFIDHRSRGHSHPNSYARKQWQLVLKAFATVSDKAMARFEAERDGTSIDDESGQVTPSVDSSTLESSEQNRTGMISGQGSSEFPDSGREGGQDGGLVVQEGMQAMQIDDGQGSSQGDGSSRATAGASSMGTS